MDAQRLFTRYHRLVVTMAEQTVPDAGRHPAKPMLHDLLARFDREAAALSTKDGHWLRNELAEQFEQRLNRTTSTQAREVFALALKHLE